MIVLQDAFTQHRKYFDGVDIIDIICLWSFVNAIAVTYRYLTVKFFNRINHVRLFLIVLIY